MGILYLGADHAAFEAKEELKNYLLQKSSEWKIEDLGTHSAERTNYPTYASAMADKLANSETDLGILICGSGIGVSMVANRYKRIRAATCRSEKEAKLSRQHNNANVLCLGARINSIEELKSIIEAWLAAEFEGGRHAERVAMFNELGEDV